jgi:hypothetical protein
MVALQLATNPLVWIAAYLMYRVFFTTPGRRPIDEE